MHAILITEENAAKIEESGFTAIRPMHTIEVYMSNHKDWYLVSGYVGEDGYFQDYAVLPQYILDDNFEYDPTKIQTDWDQIVRK